MSKIERKREVPLDAIFLCRSMVRIKLKNITLTDHFWWKGMREGAAKERLWGAGHTAKTERDCETVTPLLSLGNGRRRRRWWSATHFARPVHSHRSTIFTQWRQPLTRKAPPASNIMLCTSFPFPFSLSLSHKFCWLLLLLLCTAPVDSINQLLARPPPSSSFVYRSGTIDCSSSSAAAIGSTSHHHNQPGRPPQSSPAPASAAPDCLCPLALLIRQPFSIKVSFASGAISNWQSGRQQKNQKLPLLLLVNERHLSSVCVLCQAN